MIIRYFKILLIFLLLPSVSLPNVANFEGKIKLVKESIYDTLVLNLLVKGDWIRMDEFNSNGELNQSFLINLKNEKIYALSFAKKQYAELEQTSTSLTTSNLEVIKSPNSKEINGTVCNQWRVKDKNNNTVVTYWMSRQHFDFFPILVDVLSKSQTPLSILSTLPNSSNIFPMEVVSRTNLRKFMESIRVVKIENKSLPKQDFIIPKNFRELIG
ncbi:MAG: DUF4412 domain-containing protein [Bacteroidales bacterium]|nr:DUF4412 domain-containing protein [Bacteroidales bacterium]HPD96428.1 DUF4412 domain-containing protein [Tenuifilaceae bacterium]HRX32547.1 DUF4412 domain-containing protein [Tenuifilaceae bacterium]